MLRFAVALVALVAAPSGCAMDEPGGAGLALRDPAALIDDIEGELRLLVLPTDTFTCDTATGMTTPHPDEARDAAIPEAIVDQTFDKNAANVMANVPAGRWVILIRGWGVDEVSGRAEFMIASGCQTDEVASQGTKDVVVELIQNFGEGACGDSILSPDEQCEDGNTTPGDGCSDTCRSEMFQVARTAGMEAAAETLPAAAWAEGSRLSVVYDSDLMGRDIRTMMLSETGGIIEMPTALSIDGVLDGVPAGQQTLPAVAFGGGRFGAAFIAFPGGPAQTTVRFLTPDRNSPAPGVEAGTTSVLSGASTSIGMTTDGAALVVFGDAASPTGLSGRIFAAGSTMPAGDSFPVGTGLTGATAPAVAGSSTGFVVAFAAAGAIHYQRYAADGTPTDAAAVAVAGAMGDAPAVASLSDGRTAIAFAAGFTVRAQVFDAAMAPVGSLLDVGAGGEPTIAASRDRFVVAYVEGSGIMARLVSPDGAFALNRNQPPSTDAFQVATGNVSAPAAAAGGTSAEPLFIVTFQDQSTDPAGDVNGRLFPLP